MKIRNNEGKDKRIVCLILSVLFFTITAALTVFSFFFKNDFAAQSSDGGAKVLALIVTLPLLIIYYLVLFLINGASILYGAMTATSLNKAYKITGIVFSILSAIMLILNVYLTITVFGLI